MLTKEEKGILYEINNIIRQLREIKNYFEKKADGVVQYNMDKIVVIEDDERK